MTFVRHDVVDRIYDEYYGPNARKTLPSTAVFRSQRCPQCLHFRDDEPRRCMAKKRRGATFGRMTKAPNRKCKWFRGVS